MFDRFFGKKREEQSREDTLFSGLGSLTTGTAFQYDEEQKKKQQIWMKGENMMSLS